MVVVDWVVWVFVVYCWWGDVVGMVLDFDLVFFMFCGGFGFV